ncbi:MAG: hypothetical protein KGL39_50230 [Patescibacteria group bacterium]|nr:hypothetical protein [Patescibacteria group bacterium]
MPKPDKAALAGMSEIVVTEEMLAEGMKLAIDFYSECDTVHINPEDVIAIYRAMAALDPNRRALPSREDIAWSVCESGLGKKGMCVLPACLADAALCPTVKRITDAILALLGADRGTVARGNVDEVG